MLHIEVKYRLSGFAPVNSEISIFIFKNRRAKKMSCHKVLVYNFVKLNWIAHALPATTTKFIRLLHVRLLCEMRSYSKGERYSIKHSELKFCEIISWKPLTTCTRCTIAFLFSLIFFPTAPHPRWHALCTASSLNDYSRVVNCNIFHSKTREMKTTKKWNITNVTNYQAEHRGSWMITKKACY